MLRHAAHLRARVFQASRPGHLRKEPFPQPLQGCAVDRCAADVRAILHRQQQHMQVCRGLIAVDYCTQHRQRQRTCQPRKALCEVVGRVRYCGLLRQAEYRLDGLTMITSQTPANDARTGLQSLGMGTHLGSRSRPMQNGVAVCAGRVYVASSTLLRLYFAQVVPGGLQQGAGLAAIHAR
ncbi:hypothetical protein ASD94_03355 [Acidovorax sp. Root70]|nr:hypothetical protein ASD94_03355 [Acidovorax sp. Root70]